MTWNTSAKRASWRGNISGISVWRSTRSILTNTTIYMSAVPTTSLSSRRLTIQTSMKRFIWWDTSVCGHTVLTRRSARFAAACVVSDSPLCWGSMITTQMLLQQLCTYIIYSANTLMRKCLFPVRVFVRSSTTTRSIQRMSTKMSSARSYVLTGCSFHLQQSPFLPVRKRASVTVSSASPQRRFPQVYRPASVTTRRNTKHTK